MKPAPAKKAASKTSSKPSKPSKPSKSDVDVDAVRAQSLRELLVVLKAPGERSRVEFSAVFARALRVLELDDVEVARALQLSRPTVGRWARGESAPHALGRRPALLWLARLCQRKLAAYA